MSPKQEKNPAACPSSDITAYLDGELGSAAERDLESHLATCPACNNELNIQKNILLALDSSLDAPKVFELPDDFAKTVAVKAENRVDGLRSRTERRNAIFIAAALMGFSVLALGTESDVVVSAVRNVFGVFGAVVYAAGHYVFDIAFGTAVICRALFASIVGGSGAWAIVVAPVLPAAYLLSRRYFRRRRV